MNRIIIFSLCFVWIASGFLSDVVTFDRIQQLDANHVSRVRDEYSSSAKNLFHASKLISWSDQYGVQSSDVCRTGEALLTKSSKLMDTSMILQALADHKCKVAVPEKVSKPIRDGLTSKSVSKLYYSALGADAMLRVGGKVDIDFKSIVKFVAGLMEPNGMFKQGPSKKSSPLYAGMAYHILSLAFPSVSSDATVVSKISAVTEAIGPLLATAEGSEDTKLSLGQTDKVATTALVVSGAIRLSEVTGDEVDVVGEQLTGFAAFLAANQGVPDLPTQSFVVQGIRSIANNPIARPVALRVSSPDLGSDRKLRVMVTSVDNAPIGDAEVIIRRGATSGAGESISALRGKVMSKEDDRTHVLDLSGVSLSPAAYEISVSVSPAATFAPVDAATLSFQIKAFATLGVAEVTVTTSKKLKRAGTTVSVEYPNKLGEKLLAYAGQHLHVKVPIVAEATGTPLQPHQVFLLVRSVNTGAHEYYVARPARDSAGTHEINLDVGDRVVLGALAERGDYSLTLLVGDQSLTKPIRWELGTVTLEPPAEPPKSPEVLYTTPLLHESDTTLKALPEIIHEFREPDSRPPTTVSLVFTALTIAPTVAFIFGALLIGGNVKGFPTGVGFIYAVIFHVTLATIIALFGLYWLQLSMMQVLQCLLVLGPVLVLVGHRLMSNLLEEEKKRAAAPADKKDK